MRKFEVLKALLADADRDALKFYVKGNKAAGTRLRGSLQRTKILAQELRQEILARKKKNQG